MKYIYFVAILYIFAATFFYPIRVAATNEVFFQISDTHVADDAKHSSQKTYLENWIAETNNSQSQFSINTGDLVDYTYKASDLGTYMNIVKNLTKTHLYISGNHDYQGTAKYNYKSFGYNEYPVFSYGDFIFLGSPPTIGSVIDWAKLEQKLKLGKGEKRLVLLQHIPLFAPSWLKCSGLPCNAPKWVQSSINTSKFNNLIKKYDVEAILSGHLHTAYQMKDKKLFFDQINASSLLANRQNVLAENNGGLWVQDGKFYEEPMVIVSPTRYDTESGLGTILVNEPIILKYFGKTNVTQVLYRINSGSYFNMTKNANVWIANVDWTKYIGSPRNLYVKILSNGVLIREISQPIKISTSFPNARPTISFSNPDFYKIIFSGQTNLSMSFDDDAGDINLVEFFIDGMQRSSWSYNKAKNRSISYAWDTKAETEGKHILRFKVTDKFGRKTYSDKFSVNVQNNTPIPTPIITQVPTITLTPTTTQMPTITPTSIVTQAPTSTPNPTIIPTPSSCISNETKEFQQGLNNYNESVDSYFYISGYSPSKAKLGDLTPWDQQYFKISGYYPKYKTLLKFGLSSIPNGSKIISAVLNLTVSSWDGQTEKPIHLFARINKAFDQKKVNWNMASSTESWSIPGALGEGSDYLSPVKPMVVRWGVNTIDITDFAQYWISNPDRNFGLMIWESNSHMATYYSSRYSSNQAKKPKLTVVYSTCN